MYDTIVFRAKTGNRQKNQGVYYEKHHIIPKCLGGQNTGENLVLLTGREHWICHKLLTYIYPTDPKISFAFIAMCNIRDSRQEGRYKPSAREYAFAKEHYSVTMQGNNNPMYGKPGYWKGKQMTESHRGNIAKALKGNTSRKGKKATEKAKQLMAQKKFKKIYQYTPSLEFVSEYDSLKEAESVTGIARGNISTVSDTGRKAGKFYWKSIKI